MGAALGRAVRALGGLHRRATPEAGEPWTRGDAGDHRRDGGAGADRARAQGMLASVLIHRAAENYASRQLAVAKSLLVSIPKGVFGGLLAERSTITECRVAHRACSPGFLEEFFSETQRHKKSRSF